MTRDTVPVLQEPPAYALCSLYIKLSREVFPFAVCLLYNLLFMKPVFSGSRLICKLHSLWGQSYLVSNHGSITFQLCYAEKVTQNLNVFIYKWGELYHLTWQLFLQWSSNQCQLQSSFPILKITVHGKMCLPHALLICGGSWKKRKSCYLRLF